MDPVDVVRAAQFLADHVADPVSLADLADHVGYSPFHLARSFERQVGVPPGRFLAGHRFQLAKRLLLDGDDRIVDVCHAAGFSAAGTFTTRFTELVGSSPTDFRRLPDLLDVAPPRPLVVPGRAPSGATVAGRVVLTDAASAELGASPFVYVGLFRRPLARGYPLSGALLSEPGEFRLPGVPEGVFWVLASALAKHAAASEQLVPAATVAGGAQYPVQVGRAGPGEGRRPHRRDVVLDVLPAWSAPVLVALPLLASPAARDWQDRR